MAVKPLLIIVVAAAMMAVAAVALVRLISGRRGLPDARGLLWQLTGLVVGFSLCAVVGLLDGPRYRLILSLPALAGICWLLGLVAVERTRPRGQNGSIRLAGLVPRTPGRYAARWA